MKKTSKIFGAVALSAALALGSAMPAFATPSYGSDSQVNASTAGAANTVVNVETTISQINVALPLQITIAANINGGAATTPTTGAYGISNRTSVPVMVTSATTSVADGADEAWELMARSAATASATVPNKTFGGIGITLTPTKNGTANVTDAKPIEFSTFTAEADEEARALASNEATNGWMINAATISGTTVTPTKLTIGVQAATTRLKAQQQTAAPAAKVVYTVALYGGEAAAEAPAE